MFGLVDCNNFYASCERVFRPDLNGKPIVVLSNNDGCVIARSNEAKTLGIPMGAPAFQCKELFAHHQIQVFSANFSLYGDMSMRVMNLLATYTPNIEIYSIDEAFLDLSGFELFDLQTYGEQMAKKVYKCTGVPVSVGFAKTKALAKVANKIAKKYPKETNGVYVIDNDEKRIKALRWLKVEDIWGIGRKLSKKLYDMNINTAHQFTQLTDAFVSKNMSVVELRLKHDLMGVPTLKMETRQDKKSIATTRSFECSYTSLEQLKERVATFAVSCAEKLRRQKSNCQTLMVFIHSNGFRKDLPQYSQNIIVQLPYASNTDMILAEYALIGLEKIFVDGFAYKKAGVIIMDFSKETEFQHNLFVQPNPKHKDLMKAVDKINFVNGDHKIKLACQDLGRKWKMKQEKLSPRYSTKLTDIITINA